VHIPSTVHSAVLVEGHELALLVPASLVVQLTYKITDVALLLSLSLLGSESVQLLSLNVVGELATMILVL